MKTININTIEVIENIERETKIKKSVKEVLENYEPQRLKDFLNYGANTGLISELIYYEDTHKFFIDNVEDIMSYLEFMNCYFYDITDTVGYDINNIVWFVFESVAREIIDEEGYFYA